MDQSPYTLYDEFISHTIGTILPDQDIYYGKSNIKISGAYHKQSDKNFLFSIGACQHIPIEIGCFIDTRIPFAKYAIKKIDETFLYDIFEGLIRYIENDNKKDLIREGYRIDKDKIPWKHMRWPKYIESILLVDHEWEQPPTSLPTKDEVAITFLTLIPIEAHAPPMPLSSLRDTKITDISFTYSPETLESYGLNKAISEKNISIILEYLDRGASVIAPYITSHFQIGKYSNQSIIEAIFELENIDVVKKYVQCGGVIPPTAIAATGRWGSEELFDFLIQHGAYVHASTLGMTGLDRAIAFKNTKGIEYLKKLQ